MDLTLNRTVFINGSIDPWSPLGMTTNKTGNLAIFINGIIVIQTDSELIIYGFKNVYFAGTSHCADMYPTFTKDSQALKAAKLQIEANLKSWISKN